MSSSKSSSEIESSDDESLILFESGSGEVSSENSDTHFDTDDEGYKYEPEYTEEELRKMGVPLSVGSDFSEASSTSADDSEQDSRLENLHWCYCTNCVITLTMSKEEAVCCKDYKNLLGKKLDSIKCVTLHEEFKTLCLNRIVLETSAIREKCHKKNFKNATNFLDRYTLLS